MHLFTDGSVNTQLKVGYGAYLLVSNSVLSDSVPFNRDMPLDSLKERVYLKRFEQTSSTLLELQTMLWALSEIAGSEVVRRKAINGEPNSRKTMSGESIGFVNGKEMVLTAYTDSQNIIGLLGRQARLEQRNYFSRKHKRLCHYELYQEFYRLTTALNCEYVKVVGHQASSNKDRIHQLFGLVDQTSRRALRENS